MRKRYISAVTTAASAMDYNIQSIAILITTAGSCTEPEIFETWLTDFWDEVAIAVALISAGRTYERA
jgi:hypothetical protein